ncbi:replication initiation protein [Shewanella decolorationis]|uniref:Initiator RepB protein n=1 Tax=Shewanella decolorationis S12 TaxID=1353536 RepID=A0ABN0PS10_9GAMM|nr:replication initiation protein [Shewanella decolorationis]ESE42895.1 initiator RepB protein [Shewanella decolorationis S12]GLR34603.1 hypothetical protein GCM10007922_41640 [Shewanella decolorationis]
MDLAVVESDLGECNVTMSNALARASHALSLIEKRVLAASIARVDSRKGNKIHAHLAEFSKIRISALDYAETYGVDPKNAYEHLKSAADHLFERQFSIKSGSGRYERITRYRWVSSATYAKNEGFIEVSFTPEVYPHLNALRNQYTTYKLKNAASFRSAYSWRLFEIARSWLEHCASGQVVTITVENLRHQLEWPESYKWNDARKRAIDPAVAEIAQFEHLDITYKVVKHGRSIHALEFVFKEQSQLEMKI